jgi:DUF4097 and DUF4098 domain-containing protein YvlB
MVLVIALPLVLAVAVPASADVTDRLSRSVALAPGTPVSLRVTIGQVQIVAWERPELAVEIVRRAPDASQLTRIPAVIDTTPTAVAITVLQSEDGRNPALRSDIVLRVPAAAKLEEIDVFEGRLDIGGISGSASAHVERGDITMTRVAGTIRAETGMGKIRLERATLSPDGMIRLRTFNGDVTVNLAERPVNARILALSMGGTIASDIPLTRRERWGPRWGEATLGTGEPVISIDVVNGNISIESERPLDVARGKR